MSTKIHLCQHQMFPLLLSNSNKSGVCQPILVKLLSIQLHENLFGS